MVVVGVDEGDVEACGMEEFGQLEHGDYVALCWKWYTYYVGFLRTHFYGFLEDNFWFNVICRVVGGGGRQ